MKPLEILNQLELLYPNAHCELNHRNAYELAVSVILSAQTTDVSVNKITPALFQRYPTVFDLAQAEPKEVQRYLRSIGLYRNKTLSIIGFAKKVVSYFNGQIPDNLEDLKSLPGIGQKTANVVLSVWFQVPRIAVDTHVERVSKRLRLAFQNDSVEKVEVKLMKKFPQDTWSKLHHQLIFFGRYFCKARNPECYHCPFTSFCYYYKHQKKNYSAE